MSLEVHNRYVKRSIYVYNKKGTLQRVVLKLADGLLLGGPPGARTLDAVPEGFQMLASEISEMSIANPENC